MAGILFENSIHGLRYVADSKRPFIERGVWCCLLVCAAIWILYQVFELWLVFSIGPTQIVVDNPRYPLAKIDFPAVTICPINKVMYSKVLAHMDTIFDRNDRTNRENFIHSMVAMSLMRYPYYDNPANYLQNKTAYILNNSELDKLMQKGVVLPIRRDEGNLLIVIKRQMPKCFLHYNSRFPEIDPFSPYFM
ncbi:unnamed protein product [Bemisia tabaci]|uniref:Uncharacterized protein n=1 Tax=Bemisia tabaci TaxID=7038 RepID=A0A9P0F2P0_BEMTA|nr:unnamed protein product [Bemisia tabaci]